MIFEKLTSLEKLNNECFDKVSLLEIKLNNAIRDLQNSQYKYDKIYIDNLIVKGYVGPSAPYKTMSDYILNNIKNYKNLSDSFKLVTNEFKDYKKKHDNMSKEVNILLQTSRKSCNDYTDNKINIFDNEINLKLNNINENMINIRMENNKEAINIGNNLNDLKDEWKKIINIKEEIYKKLDNEINEYKTEL